MPSFSSTASLLAVDVYGCAFTFFCDQRSFRLLGQYAFLTWWIVKVLAPRWLWVSNKKKKKKKGQLGAFADFRFSWASFRFQLSQWVPQTQKFRSRLLRGCKTTLQGTSEGGRRRGRQRKCWLENTQEWTSLQMPELLPTANFRKDWKGIISAVMSVMFSRRPNRSRD